MEEELVRDVFISRMKNTILQDTLTFETFAPDEVLKRAIKFEQSKQTTQAFQKSVIGSSSGGQFPGPQIKIKEEPIMAVGNKNQNYRRWNRDQFKKKWKDNKNTKIRTDQKPCTRCGKTFGEGHLKSCPAMGKTCKSCNKQNHYAKRGRSNQMNEITEENSSSEEESNLIHSFDSGDEFEIMAVESRPPLFPSLFDRKGESKNHVVNTKFKYPLCPIQEKGKRIPIHIKEKVRAELSKLLSEGHILKLDKCTSDCFIAPIVITVKKDDSIKLALDAKSINRQLYNNKYQMPNLDELLDGVSQIVTANTIGTLYFTVLDLKYAYSQIRLNAETAKQCNFNIVGGHATGTYRLLTGFDGLANMPAEFQKPWTEH